MRRKMPAALLEQSIMLLVFAWAAALCLAGFVKAHRMAEYTARLDGAVLCAQNAAEQLKHDGGLPTGESLVIRYDRDWEPAETGEYLLRIDPLDSPEGLGQAAITVTDKEGEVIFSLTAAWQEVSGHES